MAKALLVLFLFVATGCASSHNTSKLSAGASEIVSDVQEFETDGIHVIMRQSSSTPVVSAILFIKGGSTALAPNQLISTEYFAMKVAAASGDQKIGKGWFRRRMVSMGTGISGDDGRDYSALSLRCTRENFDTSWAYFAGIATQPSFDSVEFTNFKRSVLLGLNSRFDDPDVYSNVVADSLYFQGHPYGRMLSNSDVQNQTVQNIAQHYRSIMVKSRLLLSVVGNISKEELMRKIHQDLAGLPEGTYQQPHLTPPMKAFSPGATFPPFGRALPTDYMTAYYLIPSKGDSDYYAYLRLRNFFGGFVFNHIRVERNLAYAPNVDEHEGATSVGVISVQTPYVDSAVSIIYRDVDFFQSNTISESAIRSGVAGWATRNLLKTETTQSQAALLGQAVLTTGDWHNAFLSYEKLAQVTGPQIVNAAQKYLRNFNWVIVGDTTHVDRALLMSR